MDQHTVKVECLNNAGSNIESTDEEKYQALQIASKNGSIESVQSLLKKGVYTKVWTKYGDSPVMLAAINGHKNIVELFINSDERAKIKWTEEENWTVFLNAIKYAWPEIVLYLLKKGIDLEVQARRGESLLLLYAKQADKIGVTFLLNAGLNFRSFGKDNYTVLHYASKFGWVDIVHALLKVGVDTQVKTKDYGYTPLLFAAENNHKNVVELLIDEGTDINCSSGLTGYTVLHCASEHGWWDIAQTLLKKGANTQVRTERYGNTPLFLAALNNHKDVVELLINEVAEVNCTDGLHGYTVLHFASKNGWFDIVECLLKKGADIQVKCDVGNTPLLLAALQRHKDIVKLLIDSGADLNCPDCRDSYTVLHVASRYGWFEIVQSLLKKGANIEALSNFGETPLLVAYENGKLEVVEQLINAGADINIRSFNNCFPIGVKIGKFRDNKILTLLFQNGLYLKPFDFFRILRASVLKKYFLRNIKICFRSIINEFNHKYLTQLYELPKASEILPNIEQMRIRNNSQVAQDVLQSIKQEIIVKGHCNIFKVHLKALKVLCVKSIIRFCDNKEHQDIALYQQKRSASSDHEPQLALPSSKKMCLNKI